MLLHSRTYFWLIWISVTFLDLALLFEAYLAFLLYIIFATVRLEIDFVSLISCLVELVF